MDEPRHTSHPEARAGTDEQRTLSAVVTCYKDAQAIPLMHQRLTEVFSRLRVNYEIIFVNDASPDDADDVLHKLTASDSHVLAIEHSRNFGSQNAFISGMQIATGDGVIVLDGDLQDPPELIADFYEKWRAGYDVVYGCRGRREGSLQLALFAKLFYRLFRKLSYVPIPVDAGDFALMDRRVVDVILALPETDQFLRGLRAWVGFEQIGVDYVRPKRVFGRSTHSWLKNIWWAKKGIFAFTFAPIEVLGYVGGILTLLSFGAVLYGVVDAFQHPHAPLGIALLLSVVAFFGSLNLLAAAVVGEYVVKILEEAKRRPRFIRKAIRVGEQHLTSAADIDSFVRSRSGQTGARTDTGRGKA